MTLFGEMCAAHRTSPPSDPMSLNLLDVNGVNAHLMQLMGEMDLNIKCEGLDALNYLVNNIVSVNKIRLRRGKERRGGDK